MIKLYKKIAETPLEALKRLRRQRPGLKEARLSYAGRLDPMACGLMPVLVDEENDRREEFLSTDKTYVFTILFGVSTDTFDLLGLPTATCWLTDCNADELETELVDICNRLVGNQDMTYPPYSAKTVSVDGKKWPLWKIARVDRLDEITLPTKSVTVYDLAVGQTKAISNQYLQSYITHYLTKVDGDFRQDKILTHWKNDLDDAPQTLPTATVRMSCSSGTYVRRITDEIGKMFGVPVCTLTILRTNYDY
jgi:tRNA pseudouridine55 synthase